MTEPKSENTINNSQPESGDESPVIESEQTEVKNKSKLRKSLEVFVALFGVAFLITLLLLAPDSKGEMSGVNLAIEFMVRYQLAESESEASVIEQRMQEITGTTSNEHYTSHADIIQSAVTLYESQNPDSEVFFPTTSFSDQDVASIGFSLVGDALSDSEGYIEEFLYKLSDTNSTDFYRKAPQEFANFMWSAKQIYPIFEGSSFQKATEGLRGSELDKVFEEQMLSIQGLVEQMHSESGALVGQDQILAHFLERNEGNLMLSIVDLSTFYKWALRHSPLQQDIEWFYTHILDQTNPNFSLNNFPQFNDPELSREDSDTILSIIGLNYHDWGIIAFLGFDNISTVQLGVIGEYLEYDHVAEPYKVRQDYTLLLNLEDLELP